MKKQEVTKNIKIPNKNLEILKQNFPQCFDKKGNFDFDKFKKEISKTEDIDFTKESYGMDWLGKSYARLIASDEATTLLKEDEDWNNKEENKNSENLLIKGDNLEVLKHLSNAYYEKIKMIYIDPPYNTGNDGFVYQDDRKFSVEELSKLAGIDEEKAKRIFDFTQSKSNSHSAWLTFMYPRLYIAKQLLKDDGVIFVSIDDNEVAQLRILMDEIFGEENFVTELKIQVRYDSKSLNEKKDFQEVQESVFLYGKNHSLVEFNKPIEEYSLDKFNLEIKHNELPTKIKNINGRKVDIWSKGDFSIKKVAKPSEDYFKETWLTGSIYSNTGHGTMYKRIIENRVKEDGYGCLYRIHGIGEDGLGYRYYTNPKEKKYNKGKMYTKVPLNKLEDIKKGKTVLKENPIISYADFSADFGNIRHEGGVSFNSGKKPVKMLKQFVNYIKDNKNDIILDFFAGSGTTGDAVIQLNAEDGGNRKYILVQLPEEIDKKKNKTAYDFVKNKLNVENPTIFEITKERLIRSAKKIKKETINKKIQEKQKEIKELESKLDLENKTEKIQQLKNEIRALENQDFGFKIFETIPIWEDYNLEAEEFDPQQKLFDESKLTKEDLKTLLITWKTYDGFSLTQNLKEIDLDGYTGHYLDNKLYLIDKGFETKNLKKLLEEIDGNKDFNPTIIIVFGYNFESKAMREIADNVKNYTNKKQIHIDFITRY